ncbi:MAG: cation-translocating P-type ATPase [Verrucomicrobia bacterium]|nr:MAG: cation-translocating P-type ATPase [Verrucomicrobiota bacterium]
MAGGYEKDNLRPVPSGAGAEGGFRICVLQPGWFASRAVTTADDNTAPAAAMDSARAAAEAGAAGETADQRAWVRLAIALVVAGQGMAFGLAANMSPPSGWAFWALHGALAASAVAVLWLLGGPLWRESIATARAGRITVDQLFLVTLTGSFAVSVYSTVREEGPVFYELVAILLAIYTAGKLVGAQSRARALAAIRTLREAHRAGRVRNARGELEERPVEAIRPGETVIVAAGETVPVDGVVREGQGLVWTTPLTGEPTPRRFGPGDALYAGMRSVDGAFAIEVTAAGGARRLDGMLATIEQARLQPSGLQRQADRLAAKFVPLVLVVSAGTMIGWYVAAGLHEAIVNGLAVLVVACPCALGLATPLGIWSGLVGLGRLGLVATTGEFVDRLARVNVAFFDKTGTLCRPDLSVSALETLPGAPLAGGELAAVIAVAEQAADHPIAKTLRGIAKGDLSGFALVEGRVVPGFGLEARVARRRDGRVFAVRLGVVETDRGRAGKAARPAGERSVGVAVDGIPAARIRLRERAYDDAGAVFRELEALGVRSEILTGDPEFGAALWPGVPRRVGLTPEEKAAAIRERQAAGDSVLFAGDGLNDAPALAQADASIAIQHGAELARGSAMALTRGESLGTLPEAIRLARRVRRAIVGNLRVAAVYNAVGMGIAAAGWLHPVLAAVLMGASSLFVSGRVLAAAGNEVAAGKGVLTFDARK